MKVRQLVESNDEKNRLERARKAAGPFVTIRPASKAPAATYQIKVAMDGQKVGRPMKFSSGADLSAHLDRMTSQVGGPVVATGTSKFIKGLMFG